MGEACPFCKAELWTHTEEEMDLDTGEGYSITYTECTGCDYEEELEPQDIEP